jgi:hypothetical protein
MGSRTLGALLVTASVVLVAGCAQVADRAGGTGATPDVTAGTAVAADEPSTTNRSPADGQRARHYRYPPAPEVVDPDAEPTSAAADAIGRLVAGFADGRLDLAAVGAVAGTGDVRLAWLLADLLRFFGGDDGDALLAGFETLVRVGIADDPDLAQSPWLATTNHLIAWDTPAYPGYGEDKLQLLLQVEPRWEPLLADAGAAIDWRYLNWGGVLIDDRPLGTRERCPRGCIPALDDPAVTDAVGGSWYPDDGIVFGIVEGDEALAIPKNIAEVHEMFNLTLGGRRFGVPYCTLCGSAQAYRTDELAGGQIVLRTSGLLSRSNKVMFDLATMSVFDTFTGAAVSGPLRDEGVVLTEVSVVRSTWGAWKADHPDTSIIAADGGIGSDYPEDPLRGRDDDGPIFPVGAVDERLPEQELVVGVIASDGSALAFLADDAGAAARRGDPPTLAGVALVEDGDGFRAFDVGSGAELPAREAFWFAWSQFHPETELWEM